MNIRTRGVRAGEKIRRHAKKARVILPSDSRNGARQKVGQKLKPRMPVATMIKNHFAFVLCERLTAQKLFLTTAQNRDFIRPSHLISKSVLESWYWSNRQMKLANCPYFERTAFREKWND
jgi:hypothetical protein